MRFNGINTAVVTGVESCNGNAASVSGQGTYTVNADCTGTIQAVSPNSGAYFFSIADGGKRINMVVTTSGITGTGVIIKRFQ